MYSDIEEFAFYESGLSAHGCIDKLDNFARDSITRYGRILLQKQKERFINGFEGCCYACEPVGIMNQELEKINDELKAEIESLKLAT